MTSTLLKSASAPRLNAPTIHRLSNGMVIVAEQMPVEAVNLSLWLNVGSAVESNDINGMAHFLEHMIFKGTARLESGEFERRIEEQGAVTNAATSQDYTHYYITTAPQHFAELTPLQLEVVLNASIPDEAFERERSVVLEEIRRSEDNPRRRTFQHLMELSFEHLPYRRSVLGPSAVIEGLKPQQMRDFHQGWYQPESMTAVAVGNLPVEQMIEVIERGLAGTRFADSEERSPLPHRSTHAPETPFSGIVRQEVVDDTLQQARLVMAWRVPGLADLEDTYALDVLASVLGHGRTSRLVRDLREERGLVSGIHATNMTSALQGLFYVSAQMPVENVAAVEAAIAQHIRDINEALVKTQEIARVCTQVANRFVFGSETPSDRAGLYGYYQTLLGDLTPVLTYPTCIQSLRPADLQKAAQRYLDPEAYGIVIQRPAA